MTGLEEIEDRDFIKRCNLCADMVVPEYRSGLRSYSCTGTVAKRWQAAWDGACIAFGDVPENYKVAIDRPDHGR